MTSTPTVPDTADARAVAELFDRIAETWRTADPHGYGECFTADADYVTFVGTHLRGRRQIVEAHAALWEQFQKDTRLHQRIRTLRFVTADVAVLVTEGAVTPAKQAEPKPGDRKVQTLVAVRQADAATGWRFAAFQNTKHRRLMERFAAKRDRRIAPEAV